MPETNWTWSLHEKIPSSLPIAHEYLEKLFRALVEAGWDGQDYFHVQMASEEAIVNAVTHGNHQSPDKQVELEMQVSPDLVQLRIKDEGQGFRPADLPDPRSDERLDLTHGRGVLIIREMMSEVRYLGCGNEVVMIRRRFDPKFMVEDDDDDIFTDD